MAQELTFNITEDVRRLKRPTSVKDFQLSFGHADQGPTDVVIGDDGNIVQGRYGDSARQVFVNVVQGKNNEPVDITGYLPEFNGCIPDAEHIVIDNWDGVLVDPRHGRFRFDFPIQAFTVAGSYKQAYFRLVQNGTGKTLATLEFDMQVLEDFVYSNIVPQNYVTPYLDMINKLKDAYTNFVGKTQGSFDQAKQRLDDIMSGVEERADTVEQRLKIEQQALETLSQKINDNNLFTQAEADAFKQVIQRQFDELLKLSFEEGSEDNVTAQQSKSLYSYASEGFAKREALAPNVLRVGTLNLALDGALNIGIDVNNFWSETDKTARRQTENQMAMDWMGCNIVGCQEAMSSMLSGSYNSFNRAMADDSMYPNLYVGLSPEVNHQLQTHNGMREGNAIFADLQMSYVALTAYSSDPNRSYLAYRTTFNNKNVLVVVTHNNVNDESEFEQLATFCGQQVFDACIILADTNNDPDSQCIAKLLAAGFDIVSKKDDNTMITEPAYSGHQMQIFYKGCVLQKKELYDVTTFEGSDHKAIVAEFKVGD